MVHKKVNINSCNKNTHGVGVKVANMVYARKLLSKKSEADFANGFTFGYENIFVQKLQSWNGVVRNVEESYSDPLQ